MNVPDPEGIIRKVTTGIAAGFGLTVIFATIAIVVAIPLAFLAFFVMLFTTQ